MEVRIFCGTCATLHESLYIVKIKLVTYLLTICFESFENVFANKIDIIDTDPHENTMAKLLAFWDQMQTDIRFLTYS